MKNTKKNKAGILAIGFAAISLYLSAFAALSSTLSGMTIKGFSAGDMISYLAQGMVCIILIWGSAKLLDVYTEKAKMSDEQASV